MSKWIKKDDQVVVIAGNDKGVAGTVLSRSKDRIIVKGVNVRKKHMKRRSENEKSQIVEIERPIHISNVALSDKDGKKMKVVLRQGTKDGKKALYTQDGKKEKLLRVVKK